MAVWLLIVLTVIILAAWWFYTRRLDWQFKHVASLLQTMTKQRQVNAAAARTLVRQIYKLLHVSLAANKADAAYQAFDMLKLALGHGWGKSGESARLTAAIYLALRTGQPDAAGHGIDTFRPMLKNIPADELPAAIEQLGLIAVVSLKQRQNFLAARAVEVIFYAASITQDEAARRAVLRAVRLVGLIALRRRDTGLIREMQVKIAGWLAAEALTSPVHELAGWVLASWLHRAVKAGDAALFEIITQYINQLADKQVLAEDALASIITECSHLSGMDSLNPFSPLTGRVSMFSLELAVELKVLAIWRYALDGALQAARLAVSQRTLAESLDVVYPLVEMGRRLLTAELNAGPMTDTFREQSLYILLRECLQLVEFVARQNFTTTPAAIIDEIYQDWIKRQANIGQHKSIRRFCQLLFLYCTRIKRRQKRMSHEDCSFNTKSVISCANQERLKNLGFL